MNSGSVSALVIAAGSLITAIASLISAIKTRGTAKDNTTKLVKHEEEISTIQSDVGEVKEALNGAVSGDGKHAAKTTDAVGPVETTMRKTDTGLGRLPGIHMRSS